MLYHCQAGCGQEISAFAWTVEGKRVCQSCLYRRTRSLNASRCMCGRRFQANPMTQTSADGRRFIACAICLQPRVYLKGK
jgi:hypothetical protein